MVKKESRAAERSQRRLAFKGTSRTCWRLPAVMWELLIIGPLISKNVLGGGLLFM